MDLNALLQYDFYGEMYIGMARRWAIKLEIYCCIEIFVIVRVFGFLQKAFQQKFVIIRVFGCLHEFILWCSFQKAFWTD